MCLDSRGNQTRDLLDRIRLLQPFDQGANLCSQKYNFTVLRISGFLNYFKLFLNDWTNLIKMFYLSINQLMSRSSHSKIWRLKQLQRR